MILHAERGVTTGVPPAAPIGVPRVRPDSLKIHRLLRQAMHVRPGSIDTVLVTFRDPFAGDTAFINRFRGGNPTRRLKAISDSLVARRAPVYQRLADTLRAYGATVLPPRYRLSMALLVTIRLGAIDSLSRNSEVFHIDPLHGGGPPQTGPCGDQTSTHLVAAKALGLTSPLVHPDNLLGKLALLDTGVLRTHDLLRTGPSPWAAGSLVTPMNLLLRCSGPGTGAAPCVDESGSQEDVDPTGHGTSTAAILAANGAMGREQAGLTRARIDSYRVYDLPGQVGLPPLNYDSVPNAFDHAVLDSAHYLIVAEIADGDSYNDFTAKANAAYDMGALVIAANGNQHLAYPDPVPPPANAARAIGVGMYCIKDQKFASGNTRGTTLDGRGKPDVGGLTSIWTAVKAGPQAMNSYGGTSGATPTVAAVALVLRNWMKDSAGNVDPGQVYAGLILCGLGGSVDDEQGAGLVRIPDDGVLWKGKANVRAGDSLEIQVPQGGVKFSRLEGAAWWPEYDVSDGGGPAPERRAWVALRLTNPRRAATSVSDARWSVFQRTSVTSSTADLDATWTLTLVGRSIPPGESRDVYIAVWGHE